MEGTARRAEARPARLISQLLLTLWANESGLNGPTHLFANPTGRLQCWYAQVATFEESTDQVQSGIDHVLDDVILALEDIEGRPLLRMMALGR